MPDRVRRPLVADNWKMNGLSASLAEIAALCDQLGKPGDPGCDVMVCPPATLIGQLAGLVGERQVPLLVGAQDCHSQQNGAHTGDIAAEMLADAGVGAVIVGHSERRQTYGEGDALVREKASAAHRAGLIAIICIGETAEERDAGRAEQIVSSQLIGSLPPDSDGANTVLAYEPVWAIGTGRTPSRDDIEVMHGVIRRRVATIVGVEAGYMRMLYGGSVKPDNAEELLSADDVDGALVGGASLKAVDLWGIVTTYR